MDNAKANIPVTEDVNVSEKFGKFHIATANVPAKGNYLTLVLRDMRPFDMTLSNTLEEARTAHESFVAAAVLYSLSHGEVEASEVLGAMMPEAQVDRSMMN